MRSLIALYLIALNLLPLLGYNQNDSLSKNQTLASLDHYKNLLSTEIKNENLSGMADAYYEMGRFYKELKNYPDAIFNSEKALQLYLYLGNKEYAADTYLCLGNAYSDARKFSPAVKYYSNAIELFHKIGYYQSVAKIYMNIGNVYINQNNYTSAIDNYKKGCKIFKEENDQLSLAFGNDVIAANLYYLGESEKAINYYLSGVQIWDKLGKENKIAESFCFIANIYDEKGDYDRSNNYNLKAISICEKIGIQNTMTMAQAYNGLGQNYHSMGNYSKALQFHLKSIEIAQQLNDKKGESAGYTNLSNVFFRMGDYMKSIDYSMKSIEIKDSLGFNKEKSINYNNLGLSYSNIGNKVKAIEYFEKAIMLDTIYKTTKPNPYINIGGVYSDLGNNSKALEYYNKALNICESSDLYRREISALFTNIANIYIVNGDYKMSKIYIKKSIDLSKEINANTFLAGAYHVLGRIYFKEKLFSKALELNKKSYELFKTLDEKKGMLNAINEIVLSNISNSDFLEAYNYSILSVEIIKKSILQNIIVMNENERDVFWIGKDDYFNSLLLNTTKIFLRVPLMSELAYNNLCITKAFLMEASSDLKTIVYNTKDTALINLFEDLKSFQKHLIKLTSEGSDKYQLISNLENKIDSLDLLLSRKMSSYKDYKKNFSLNWKDVQTNLNINEASIEFTRYYDDSDSTYHYMALVVKQGDKHPQLVKLCKENEIKQYSPETELNLIYDLVWKPLLPSLTNVKTIYYSPSGILNNIPFQALYKEENGQREYVMDKFTLHQLTSTRYLALGLKQKEQEPIESSIALFGGINYNDFPNAVIDTLNSDESSEAAFLYKNAIVLNRELDSTRTGAKYLPGTKKEVETIANVLNAKQWNIDISEGKNATENKIKSLSGNNSKAILHIATHGFAFPDKEEKRKDLAFNMMSGNNKYKAFDNPMIRSGLLFGGANLTWQGKGDSLLNTTNEDGVLTAYELSQLDLSNTKLAVLSACETGKGEIQGSEGTFGLKRALKLAGVDNMIVSLWKVPDDATMEMMTLFYKELANTKKPVSSFETAQKAMRLNHPNEPIKWAGFVFVR